MRECWDCKHSRAATIDQVARYLKCNLDHELTAWDENCSKWEAIIIGKEVL